MADPERLVLAARVRMIRRSLEAVRNALIVVEQERKVMRDLLPTILEQTYAKLNDVDAAADAIRNLVQLNPQYGVPVKTQTMEIRARTEEIRAHLLEVQGNSRAIGRMQVETETALKEDFLKGINDQIDAAETLLEVIRNAATPADIQAAWKTQGGLFADSQQFFAEYVELLTGLALRDSGFDKGLSEIGDALIRRGIAGWYSLTIPAHKPPDTPTRARFIHLGFPEWTPWALPLAAYDVGRMELQNGALPALVEAASQSGVPRASVESALADAIATYLVGPSYAWATLVIRFDPGAGYTERRVASQRLALMLAALRSHDDPARPTERLFSAVADDLATAWEVAVSEAGDIKPSKEDLKSAGSEMSSAQIADAIKALRGYRVRALSADEWQTVVEVAGELEAGGPFRPLDDMRTVLNVAWKVRIDSQLDKSADEAPVVDLGEQLGRMLAQCALGVADGAASANRGRALVVQR